MNLILKHIQNWIEIVSRIVSRIHKKLRHCKRLYPEFSRIDSSKLNAEFWAMMEVKKMGMKSVCAAPDAGVRPHRYFSAPKQ